MTYPLTPRQQQALAVIDEALATTGTSPSYSELAIALDTCKTNARQIVSSLERRGRVKRLPGHRRSITITKPLTERLSTQSRAEKLLARWHQAGLLAVNPSNEMLRELLEMAT